MVSQHPPILLNLYLMIIAFHDIFEDSFSFQYQITSQQLVKELKNIYSQFHSELLATIFCGGQGISPGSPLSPPSEIFSIAKALLKRLFVSISQHAEQSMNSSYYLLMDKQSKNITEWWFLCDPAVVGTYCMFCFIIIYMYMKTYETLVTFNESIALLDKVSD